MRPTAIMYIFGMWQCLAVICINPVNQAPVVQPFPTGGVGGGGGQEFLYLD